MSALERTAQAAPYRAARSQRHRVLVSPVVTCMVVLARAWCLAPAASAECATSTHAASDAGRQSRTLPVVSGVIEPTATAIAAVIHITAAIAITAVTVDIVAQAKEVRQELLQTARGRKFKE